MTGAKEGCPNTHTRLEAEWKFFKRWREGLYTYDDCILTTYECTEMHANYYELKQNPHNIHLIREYATKIIRLLDV